MYLKTQVYLEDFDLATGRMQMLSVFPIFIFLEGVNLDSEGHTFLSTMLPHSELCTDAMYLEKETQKYAPNCNSATVMLVQHRQIIKLSAYV